MFVEDRKKMKGRKKRKKEGNFIDICDFFPNQYFINNY